jgi:hypothetical protein
MSCLLVLGHHSLVKITVTVAVTAGDRHREATKPPSLTRLGSLSLLAKGRFNKMANCTPRLSIAEFVSYITDDVKFVC